MAKDKLDCNKHSFGDVLSLSIITGGLITLRRFVYLMRSLAMKKKTTFLLRIQSYSVITIKDKTSK